MKVTDLKAQHQVTAVGKMLDAKSQIEYLNAEVVPFFTNMEKWEVDEYKAVLKDHTNLIEKLKAFIIKHEAIFNDILWYYDLTVTVFIAKYFSNTTPVKMKTAFYIYKTGVTSKITKIVYPENEPYDVNSKKEFYLSLGYTVTDI